jgi:cytochrome c peroxidase
MKYSLLISTVFFLLGCQAELPQPEVTATGLIHIPEGFPQLGVQAENPLSAEGIALGKKLFFDPILSADSSISCSSCHQPAIAFADQSALSTGINQQAGRRNAPSLINVGFYHTGLFWDGRAPSLESQALEPVEDPLEMGADWDSVEMRLRQHEEYPELFARAFFTKEPSDIDRYLAARALAQYQRTLTSGPTRYTLAEKGEAELTESEKRGKDIFFDASENLPRGECAHCHTPPLFTDLTYMNNGLDAVNRLEEYPDKGRGEVTQSVYDYGRFRVPSLINVGITAPYMHDGRFETLEEVVQHYNTGGHFAANVDPKVRKLHLSDQNQLDLINFLKTLTDTIFVR